MDLNFRIEMMRRFLVVLILIGVTVACSKQKEQEQSVAEKPAQENKIVVPEGVTIEKQTEADTLKGSLKAYSLLQSGPVRIAITYHSPAVRGRIIWGGLIPLGQVWVTGAHMATTFESNYDFVMGDKIIKAGKYALFTIPTKDKWTIIINSNWQQHLADEYKMEEDIVRFTITPQTQAENQERLQYAIETRSTTDFAFHIRWEKVKVSVPFTIINPEFD